MSFVERNTEHDTQGLVSIVIKTVSRKQETGELRQVYDLMVEDNHEYFANGVLVHNCIDASRYIAMEKLGNKQEVQILNRELLGL